MTTTKYKICSGHRRCLVFCASLISAPQHHQEASAIITLSLEEEADARRGRNLLSFTLRKQQQSQDSKVGRPAGSQPLRYSTRPLNKHPEAGSL